MFEASQYSEEHLLNDLERFGFLSIRLIHDANNTISSIVGNAQLAMEFPDDKEELMESLRAIEKSTARFAREVSLMSQYRRKIALPLEKITLDEFVDEFRGYCSLNKIFWEGGRNQFSHNDRVVYTRRLFLSTLEMIRPNLKSVHQLYGEDQRSPANEITFKCFLNKIDGENRLAPVIEILVFEILRSLEMRLVCEYGEENAYLLFIIPLQPKNNQIT